MDKEIKQPILFFKFTQGVSVIGVQQIDRIVEVVEETLQGKSFYDEFSFQCIHTDNNFIFKCFKVYAHVYSNRSSNCKILGIIEIAEVNGV